MRTLLLLLAICVSAFVQAEPEFGKKFRVKNDALDFDAIEMRIDGVFVGYIDANARPTRFSPKEYVFASCPVDKASGKPNGYCLHWKMFNADTKRSRPLKLPGLTFVSTPAFFWPYIAYVRVPNKITPEYFEKGVVPVSCVLVEWPSEKVVAEQEVEVNVGHFETDAPESFFPPRIVQKSNSLEVTCIEYNGKDGGNAIATLSILLKP